MKRVCRQCKVFVSEGSCPICSNSDFASSWQGRINVLDAGKSFVGKKAGVAKNGEYAIRVR